MAAACEEAPVAGIARGDVILTTLARKQRSELASITAPDALRLKCELAADCRRYDSLRRAA